MASVALLIGSVLYLLHASVFGKRNNSKCLSHYSAREVILPLRPQLKFTLSGSSGFCRNLNVLEEISDIQVSAMLIMWFVDFVPQINMALPEISQMSKHRTEARPLCSLILEPDVPNANNLPGGLNGPESKKMKWNNLWPHFKPLWLSIKKSREPTTCCFNILSFWLFTSKNLCFWWECLVLFFPAFGCSDIIKI